MFKRNSSSNNLVVFGLGIVAGWFVKQLFDSPQGQKQREKVMTSARELQERLADSDQAERVREVFGRVSKDATKTYQESKDRLVKELSMLKTSLGEIDKQKYVGIVTEIVTGLSKEKKLDAQQVERLTRSLTDDFKKLKASRSEFTSSRENLDAELAAGSSPSSP